MQAARHEVHSQFFAAVTTVAKATSFLASLLSLFILNGCATLTIPAIDPSGNRIFSSTPTQLTLPQLHGPNGRNLVPNSNFPEPPAPANCLQGPPAPIAPGQTIAARTSGGDRGRCGQILLTPTRIVAPVGGEVVLIAGVCGEDGYLVSGEPIEWMLAPDSVGEIIEVGDDMKGKRRSAWSKAAKPVVEKLDVDFARGRTSAEAGRITRGSLRPTDDLVLKKGQTWVSLTSPTEGLSRVTVLAPDSDVWDRRRQTATIYWIDASWQFPPPSQTLRVGQIADLITLVKKAEGFVPAKDWIVKYRIANFNEGVGEFPRTTGDGSGIDVLVNSDAKAITQVRNVSNKPGTAIVTIEVCKPKEDAEKMPELTLARSQVMLTWSAPLLELKVNRSGDTAIVGEPIDYRIILTNSGDLAAENVRLKMDLKNPGLQATYPEGFVPGSRSELGAVWEQGVVQARSILELPVQIIPTREGDYRIDFSAEATPGFAQTAPITLNVVKPQLALTFAPARGMERVEVGQPTIFEVVVTNNGRSTLNQVSLSIDSDAGLQHAQNGSNVITQTIPYLPPGQPQSLNVQFIVRKAGQLGARLVAQVNGRQVADTKAFVLGIEAQPRQSNMAVQLRTKSGSTAIGPNRETDIVTAMVLNNGQTPLSNIQVLVEYESSFELSQASEGVNVNRQQRQLTWPIALLEPGKQIAVEMIFRSIDGVSPASVRITARSVEGLNAQETLNFNRPPNSGGEAPILPSSPDSSVLPPPGSGASLKPSKANSNPWSLSVVPIENQVGVGQLARYSITFQNTRDKADQNVAIDISIPKGVQVAGLSRGEGTPVSTKKSDDGRVLRMEPIRHLRANEEVQLVLELEQTSPGSGKPEVFLRSAADPLGVRQ